MQVVASQTVSSDEARRQAVIEYWALWHGECMSDRHIAKECLCTDLRHKSNREIASNPEWDSRLKADAKLVKSMKKEYADEKFALFRPITEEIERIRAIKRCHLCGMPVDTSPTEIIKGVELHTRCIDMFNEEQEWKCKIWYGHIFRYKGVIPLYTEIQKKRKEHALVS